MKCYYEELGIPRDANDADIKTAYRKLALRWHPDKNPNAVDEAKERFQLIQQAYEVLSDPQERAWYDNHRDQILRGKNSDYTENCLDVFEYFTSSCFRGYDDDEKGFYAVYREVFKKLAAEDAEFMDDEDDVEEIPTFGDSNSSYEDVVGPFYAYWQSYCTKKTYTWLCPYDVKEIRDRRVLREVEKEMKKLVQKARKERNEEVRNLVSFVRKRDKRVQAYRRLLEERAELNRKKQEQNRLEQIRKRQRELEEMREQSKQNPQHKNDDYEEQLKQLAQDYGDSSDEEDLDDTEDEEADGVENEKNDEADGTEEEFYVDDLYCVACNKMFKNERAYENHESSKKHREALERMKLEMQAEEEAFQENNEDEQESEELVDSEAELKEEAAAQSDEDEEVAGTTEAHLDDTNVDVEELLVGKKAKKNKKARKNAKLNKSQLPTTEEHDEHGEEAVVADFLAQAKIADSEEDDWGNSGKKSARKNKNKKQTKKTAKEVEENKTVKAEIKVAQTKEEPKAAQQQKATSAKTEQKLVVESTDEDDAIEEIDTVKKSQPKSKPKANASSATSNASNHVCVTCKANFPSKNKLFSHLKITNHGVYIPKTSNDSTSSTTAEGSKAKKGKGKKK